MTRRRGLTPEEETLWRKAMRDVAPVRGKKPLIEKLVSSSQSPVKNEGGAHAGLLPARRRHSQEGEVRRPPPLPARSQHPFAAGDPKLDRRAGRGRIPVEAVLDLHGHNQRTAHSALTRFVSNAHAHGARCVLVITGKGAPAGRETYGAGGGVLRARFYDWLEEEPLRKLVSRASPAHQRHGGAGAFYIFLKGRKP